MPPPPPPNGELPLMKPHIDLSYLLLAEILKNRAMLIGQVPPGLPWWQVRQKRKWVSVSAWVFGRYPCRAQGSDTEPKLAVRRPGRHLGLSRHLPGAGD